MHRGKTLRYVCTFREKTFNGTTKTDKDFIGDFISKINLQNYFNSRTTDKKLKYKEKLIIQ